jgi:hypothetical protein
MARDEAATTASPSGTLSAGLNSAPALQRACADPHLTRTPQPPRLRPPSRPMPGHHRGTGRGLGSIQNHRPQTYQPGPPRAIGARIAIRAVMWSNSSPPPLVRCGRNRRQVSGRLLACSRGLMLASVGERLPSEPSYRIKHGVEADRVALDVFDVDQSAHAIAALISGDAVHMLPSPQMGDALSNILGTRYSARAMELLSFRTRGAGGVKSAWAARPQVRQAKAAY